MISRTHTEKSTNGSMFTIPLVVQQRQANLGGSLASQSSQLVGEFQAKKRSRLADYLIGFTKSKLAVKHIFPTLVTI